MDTLEASDRSSVEAIFVHLECFKTEHSNLVLGSDPNGSRYLRKREFISRPQSAVHNLIRKNLFEVTLRAPLRAQAMPSPESSAAPLQRQND